MGCGRDGSTVHQGQGCLEEKGNDKTVSVNHSLKLNSLSYTPRTNTEANFFALLFKLIAMTTHVPFQEMARVRRDAPQRQGSHSVPVSQDSLLRQTGIHVMVWNLTLDLDQMCGL